MFTSLLMLVVYCFKSFKLFISQSYVIIMFCTIKTCFKENVEYYTVNTETQCPTLCAVLNSIGSI